MGVSQRRWRDRGVCHFGAKETQPVYRERDRETERWVRERGGSRGRDGVRGREQVIPEVG